MSIVLELVKNILETPFDRFDESVVDGARMRVIDVVGCLIAGANAPGCSIVRDMVRDWGGKKESTILVHGGKIPAHNAAMINSIMARSYDFEPVGPYVDGKNTPGHISGTTVPTAIAAAEQRAVSGKDLLTALILGDDVASRINAASGFSVDQGWDCVGTANMFGATAVAGRLARLDERQMLNAFGIVLNQMGGTMQNIFDGAHSFKLIQGLAARAGIFSVALASNGFTGVEDPLFSKHGYFSLYCENYEPDILTKDLGKAFYADNTFKPYPCCRANHAAIDCALAVACNNNLTAEEITEVIVTVPPVEYDFAVGQSFKVRRVPQIDAAFSLQYNVANVLLRREVRLEHFSEESIKDPGIMKIIDKITLEKSTGHEKFLAAGIRVTTKDGGYYEKRVDEPKGDDLFTPLTAAEKTDKFISNVIFSETIPLENAKKVLMLLKNLEKVDDIAEIITWLV